MAVDYDAPRATPGSDPEASFDVITIRRTDDQTGAADGDDAAEILESSGVDVVDEELFVPVVPMRGDEFRCGRCFLVHHRSRLAEVRGVQICVECA